VARLFSPTITRFSSVELSVELLPQNKIIEMSVKITSEAVSGG
jgi:hypothetical protein